MKPAAFEYEAPTTVSEAIASLQRFDGDAQPLAGGQSLVPMLNMRLARPGLLVDLGRIDGLDYIREEGDRLAIGAMTTKRTVERSQLVADRQPLLHAATLCIAHPQIRNRGTLGGSMAQADPAAEYPAVAVALDAELEAVGPDGERTIRAEDFFVSYLTTALQPNELVTEVRFPVKANRTGWAFDEVARRRGDFAVAGVAVTVAFDENRECCTDARIALFGVGPVPARPRGAEDLVRGERLSEELCIRAGRLAGEEIDEPISDVHASADYRRHLADVLTRKALAVALARGRDGG